MSGFYLRAGSGKWSDLFADQGAIGCILVDVNASGRRYCVGTADAEVQEIATGLPLHFVGAIVNDPVHAESVDPFSRESSVQSMAFEVSGEHLPIRDLRKTGVILQDIDVDVYWHVANKDHSLNQSLHLLSGKMAEPRYDEERDVSSFRVEDTRLRGEKPFPPVVATQDLIAGLHDEDAGKPYPVVVGTVRKLPLLDVTGGAGRTLFLVMHDKMNEWPTALPPVQVADPSYDGDANVAEVAETQQTDSNGNKYLRLETAGGATGDITGDVTGHLPATPGEAIKWLLTFFGDDPEVFDFSSTDKLDEVMSPVELGMAFNARCEGGVLDVVRDRLCGVLPIAMVQRGGKYCFEALTWGRDVTKHLRTGVNVIRRTMQPAESARGAIYNSFVARCRVSGLRGDHTAVVVANPDNNRLCVESAKRYGETPCLEVDAGDINSPDGATWLLNWLVETYTRMRVFAGYRCGLDVVDVRLWDTVSVVDEYEEWEDALFKVTEIRRGTGPWIDLGLVSVDDYTDVYGVNK